MGVPVRDIREVTVMFLDEMITITTVYADGHLDIESVPAERGVYYTTRNSTPRGERPIMVWYDHEIRWSSEPKEAKSG